MLAAKVKDTDTSKSPYKGRVTLQFQIIVSPLINFSIFFRTSLPSFLIWSPPPPPPPFYSLSPFFFADISVIFNTDCFICETVISLGLTVLISYQF